MVRCSDAAAGFVLSVAGVGMGMGVVAAVIVAVVMVVMVWRRGGRGALDVSHGVAFEADAGLGLEGAAEGAVERGAAVHDAQDRILVQFQQVARLPAHHVCRAAGAEGRAAGAVSSGLRGACGRRKRLPGSCSHD